MWVLNRNFAQIESKHLDGHYKGVGYREVVELVIILQSNMMQNEDLGGCLRII